LTCATLFQGLELEAALAAPRLQCETLEPAVVERSAGAAVIAELRRRGHRISETNRDAGSAHLIARAGDGWHGAAEQRMGASATVVA
jgi:gamma-glutamyltranspeptidase